MGKPYVPAIIIGAVPAFQLLNLNSVLAPMVFQKISSKSFIQVGNIELSPIVLLYQISY